jgi:hypothetical protein
MTAQAFIRAPTGFLVGVFWRHFEMKKQKQKPRQRRRKPNASQLKRHRNQVLDLTSQGKNRAVVAATLGIGVNRLREGYALELDAGRVQAKAAKADEAEGAALTVAEYHALDSISAAFSSPWHEANGNLIFMGTDGKGARTVADAFAAWKQRSGRWNCTGLSSRFNKTKAAEFAKIAMDYRNKFETR